MFAYGLSLTDSIWATEKCWFSHGKPREHNMFNSVIFCFLMFSFVSYIKTEHHDTTKLFVLNFANMWCHDMNCVLPALTNSFPSCICKQDIQSAYRRFLVTFRTPPWTNNCTCCQSRLVFFGFRWGIICCRQLLVAFVVLVIQMFASALQLIFYLGSPFESSRDGSPIHGNSRLEAFPQLPLEMVSIRNMLCSCYFCLFLFTP